MKRFGPRFALKELGCTRVVLTCSGWFSWLNCYELTFVAAAAAATAQLSVDSPRAGQYRAAEYYIHQSQLN